MQALLGNHFKFTSTGKLGRRYGVWRVVTALHETFNLVSPAGIPSAGLSSQVYHIAHCSFVEDRKMTLSCVKF